jgi:hypothetical protein
MTVFSGSGHVVAILPRSYVVQIHNSPAVVNVARHVGIPWAARAGAQGAWPSTVRGAGSCDGAQAGLPTVVQVGPCRVQLERWCVTQNNWEGWVARDDAGPLPAAAFAPEPGAACVAATSAGQAAALAEGLAAELTAALPVGPAAGAPGQRRAARRRVLRSM